MGVKLEVIYQGGLRCSAVHGPSGAALLTDAPLDNHGKGESFSPTDLVAAGLATCMLTIIGIFAERHALDLRGMRVAVTKEMAATPIRRIARLACEIEVPLPNDSPHREAIERAALMCPVHQSLHPDIDKPIVFRWDCKPQS